MTRPLLLDLFCGAGGCAVGYHRAGFDVVGVDIKPQKRYPFPFATEDALDILQWLIAGGAMLSREGVGYELSDFAVIHASPPCQKFSAANNIHGRTDHPDLIEPIRKLLVATRKPWVIENVERAPLRNPAIVCGLALGLNVKRHRLFESSHLLFGTGCEGHKRDYAIVFGGGARGRAHVSGVAKGGGPVIHRPTLPLARAKEAMGIDWMARDELSQAIPPAYAEYIGRQLLAQIAT